VQISRTLPGRGAWLCQGSLECFDAVSKGSIESCWTTPGYHTGKYPALAFFTTVPFGPNFGEFLRKLASKK